MADLTSGASAKIQLDPGQSLRVEAEGGTTNVTALYGAPAGTTAVTGSTTFGPYSVPAVLRVVCASGACSYATVRDEPAANALTAPQVTALQAVVSGAGKTAQALVAAVDAQAAQTALFGVGFMAPRTLTSDETPTITASATAPASDADAAAQRVVLCGGSALGGSTTELTQAQRDELRRWIGGVNWGLRPYWNGYSYRVSNSIATPNGSTSNGNQGNMQPSPGAGLSPQWGIQLTGAGAYLDAVLDGDVLFIPGFLHAVSLWVNDKLVNVAPGTGVAGTVSNTVYTSTVGGGVSYIKVKFPSVARRNIRVGWVLDKGIGDLYLRAAHDVRPRFASRPTVLMIGDSFCDTGGSDVKFCVAGQMMAQLGPAWDLVTGSVGGTGYGQADTKANFATRVQAMDVSLLQAPTAVLIVAGQNDSAAQITASAPDVLSGLRALFPRAPIFIITTYGPNSYGTAQARQDAIEAAAAAVTQCHVIRTYGATAYGGKSWVYGTGKVGATTGDGNADRYVSSDGTHPPDAGHLHWSGLFSGGIAALCRSDAVTF